MKKFNLPQSVSSGSNEDLPGSPTSQRIYQRNKKRLAIRLEEAFWLQLDDCAREDGRKLSELVFDVIDKASDGANRTSALRLYCLDWLRKRLAKTRSSGGNLDIQTALSACPSPCVIMTKEKAIVAYNTAFAQNIIAKLSGEAKDVDKGRPLTFKLDTPLEQIHEDLLHGKSQYRDTRAAFVKNDKIIRVGARFCLLESDKGPNTSLLCYLIVA